MLSLTMGDPAGVGPEIILKALKNNQEFINETITYGSYDVLDFYNKKFNYNLKLNLIKDTDEFKKDFVNIIDPNNLKIDEFKIGELSEKCGHSAYLYLEKAVKDTLNGKIDGIVTAPLNKEALHKGGHNFSGHTEILAYLTNTDSYMMVLSSEKLKVGHVTTHVSMRQACDLIKKDRVLEKINILNETLIKMGISNPSIGVCGLNAHAGENGVIGKEEIEEIIPAINIAKQNGLNINGPISPDTIFIRALNGEFDGVLAMYHDQGHIPMKILSFDSGVNISAGLPIIRTSVDHGTAFDIAGKNIAKEDSMVAAINCAKMFKKTRVL